MFFILFLICKSTVELLMRTSKTLRCLFFVVTWIALSPRIFFLVRRKGKWSTMNFVILVLPKLAASWSKEFPKGLFGKKWLIKGVVCWLTCVPTCQQNQLHHHWLKVDEKKQKQGRSWWCLWIGGALETFLTLKISISHWEFLGHNLHWYVDSHW